MWNHQRVSVVFPALNEARAIAAAVGAFTAGGIVDEVLVVDNHSTDATAALAAAAGARVIHESRPGYGYACRRGLRESTGDLIILAEPDGTFRGPDVLKLLAYADDFQMVLGTRTSRLFVWAGANMGWRLKWGNWAVAKLLQLLFNGPSLTDVGCSMRLIHRRALRTIQRKFTVGASHFLPEMTTLALLHRVPIVEVPVNYGPRVGASKITGRLGAAIRVGLRMIGLILWYRLTHRKIRSVPSRRRWRHHRRRSARAPVVAQT